MACWGLFRLREHLNACPGEGTCQPYRPTWTCANLHWPKKADQAQLLLILPPSLPLLPPHSVQHLTHSNVSLPHFWPPCSLTWGGIHPSITAWTWLLATSSRVQDMLSGRVTFVTAANHIMLMECTFHWHTVPLAVTLRLSSLYKVYIK